MSKSKSKSKKSANAGSNAKNIKALISQNKMIEAQNAEAEQKKLEEREARIKAKQEAENVKPVEADEVIVEKDANAQPAETQNENTTDVKAENKKADEKSSKNAKNKKPAKEKRGVGKRIKETVSELKKVSWPSFKNVVKKTGVVLAVVIFFGVCLLAFDFVLSMLHNLLQGNSAV